MHFWVFFVYFSVKLLTSLPSLCYMKHVWYTDDTTALGTVLHRPNIEANHLIRHLSSNLLLSLTTVGQGNAPN